MAGSTRWRKSYIMAGSVTFSDQAIGTHAGNGSIKTDIA
jgi:hypothetical protein